MCTYVRRENNYIADGKTVEMRKVTVLALNLMRMDGVKAVASLFR